MNMATSLIFMNENINKFILICVVFLKGVFLMRKIINKKVYDTETAEFVAEYHNGYFRRDFRYEYEGLYKSKKGQFFIHGIGGALSKYSESYGNGRTGIETIVLLTKEEALEWLSEHNKLEEIEKYFSDNIQEG
jgi:hypothetical protein